MRKKLKVVQITTISTYEITDIGARIRLACTVANIKLCDVGSKLGMSPSTFSQRLDKGKFTKPELVEMATAIGCTYRCYFKFDDGKAFSTPTIGQQIKDALEHADMSIGDLAVKMGLTRQAASKRLSIGKLSQEDLEAIARYMNCDYVSEFEFDDGTVI